MTVLKAVIPAAGLGTRFLPASKAVPKEMIPVVDRPGIQYVVEEAVRAGMTDIIIVTSRGKESIEDHFDYAPDLERRLEADGKAEILEEVRRPAELADIHFVRQKEALGFGHAVLMAKAHVGDEPFAVMVGDEIVPEPNGDEPRLMEEMIAAYERNAGSVVAVVEVPKEDISGYGVIDPEFIEDKVARVLDFIEKPQPQDAPSNLAARGRYVLTPDVFEAIERTGKGHGGEIQLTDAINIVAKESNVFGYVYDGPIFDVGKKLDYLETTVELALRRPDLAGDFKAYLREVVERS